ncbi:Uncharacterised protein [Mycobacterium tuberculosis]|nr:Uncharacterised protein [Mycobacterium tuberculosis]
MAVRDLIATCLLRMRANKDRHLLARRTDLLR